MASAGLDVDVVEREIEVPPTRNSRGNRKSQRLSLPRDPTAGQKNITKRKRRRSADPKRKSLLRLTNFQLEDVENEVELPPVPHKQRKMTDTLFLLLFMAYWVGMIAIFSVGLKTGDPASLIYGRDSEGRVCGGINEGFQNDKRYVDQGLAVNNDLSKQKFVAFPRVEEDLQVQLAGITIDLNPFDFDFFSVCASSCPQEGDFVCTTEAEALVAKHLADNPGETRSRDEIVQGCVQNDDVRLFGEPAAGCIDVMLGSQCFETFFNTTSFLFRCFPEFVYSVEVIQDETGCLEERNTTTLFGKVVSDCVKFKQVTKVTRVEPPDTNVLFDTFNTVSREFDQLLGDIINAKEVIIGVGIGVAAVTAFLYILALKAFVGVVIWATVLVAVAMLYAVTIFCYFKAGIFTENGLNDLAQNVTDFASGALSFIDPSDDDVNVTDDSDLQNEIDLPDFISESPDFAKEFRIMAYILTGITLFVSWMVILSVKRVNRAIEFFKEASRCIKAKPQLLLMPFFASAFGVLVISFYIASALYITSAGSLENSTISTELLTAVNVSNPEDFLDSQVFGPVTGQGLLNIYLFFGFLWSLSFVSAVSLMTISGVVSKWYWAGSPATRKANILEGDIKISLLGTFWTVFEFHLGTAAFGSLLIAFVQFIRYMAAFIQARMNSFKGKSRCVKIMHTALNCCLKCAENCVKFISHNAYYMTMLYGTSFCVSTKMAFSAFAHNLIQVATVTFLGDIILRFGQLFIVSISLFVAYVLLDGADKYRIGGDKELHSILFPVLITAFLSFFMARQVLSVYHVAIDTILLSYCQDRKLLKHRNQGGRKRKAIKATKSMNDFVESNKPNEQDFMRSPSLEVYA